MAGCNQKARKDSTKPSALGHDAMAFNQGYGYNARPQKLFKFYPDIS
jgi:hypothetical protein